MHLVTKILIVFAALFAVLLAALTMAFSYNAQSIRDSVAAERAEKLAAIANLNESQTTAQKETTNAKAEAERLSTQLAALKNDYANLQNERNTLQAAVKSAQIAAEQERNASIGKDARLQTVTQLVAAVSGENKTLRDEHVLMAKRESDYFVRIGDLESQNQVLTQNLRAVQEQMAAMKEAANKSTATASASRSGTEITTGPLITGRVSKTAKAPSGDDLAFISVGSAAGLKEGQRLNITRGNQFIAGLIIIKADVNEAVGRVDKMNKDVAVMADDTVFSRID